MMFPIRNPGRWLSVLLAIALIQSGCNAPKVNTTSPISSNRGIETLEVIPGQLPKWKKTGNLSLKPGGDVNEDDFSASIKVAKNGTKRTIQADGKEIVVTANEADLTIQGGCANLTVHGKNNKISCDFVQKIEVKGNDNKLSCDAVAEGKVIGDGNLVTWKHPAENKIPEIDFSGINNVLEQRD